jgi:succinate-semialdehyde dehydrogenase / glutarate-semialdehyde dehydrogenase
MNSIAQINPQNLLKDPSLWKTGAFINGQWLESTPHGTYALHNPATGAELVKLPRCKEEETQLAISSAQTAFEKWRKTTAKQRSEIIHQWYQLVLENKEDLATIITLEEGKPLAEARGEMDYANSFLQWFAEEAKRIRGDVIAAPKETQRIVVLKQPIGVCAAITPWNFPAAMITRKAGPALAAGCTMVVKPASQTPMTALALAELARRAGVPEGVFSVLTGNDTRVIGSVLTSHPLVRKITFTGSTEVGRTLLEQSAATIKKCSMELGGNAPSIVFDDADLELAVDGVIASKFRNTGQACISANRIYVHDAIYDAFADKLAVKVKALKVGNGLEAGVVQGPLIDANAVQKVESHIANAIEHGASVLCGGKRSELGGFFFEPTVLTNVTKDMVIAHDETFGPVAPLIRFSSEQEVIAQANDSEFGLAAYLYSQNSARVWRTSEALEAGMIGINTGLISNEVAPFGGVKQSGLGREGSHYGIDEFLEMKYMCWDGLYTE